MEGMDGWMPLEHRQGVLVNVRVDLGQGHPGLERIEECRAKQHVAMMTQLRHQHASHLGQVGIVAVGNHVSRVSRLLKRGCAPFKSPNQRLYSRAFAVSRNTFSIRSSIVSTL